VALNKKPKKVRREKIRYGQAPRNSLPAAPEEAVTTGADVGAGATGSTLSSQGEAIAPNDQTASLDSDINPLAPVEAHTGKTRFSDRAATEAKTKAAAKKTALKTKAAMAPPPLTAEEKTVQQLQAAPLGLEGDTATKKKKKKVKGAPKERIQQAPPAPPKPKPEETPIPPKSVRDNGEPVVSPPPANLPPATDTVPASTTPAPTK
jgi:peptidyl-prolyl cis-trans isomerase SurA